MVDLSQLLSELLKFSPFVALLLLAVHMLIKRQDRMEAERAKRDALIEEERKEREKRQGDNCRAEIAGLVADIRSLQESRYQDVKGLAIKGLEVLQRNAEAFERWVELERAKTDSGLHRTVKDG